MTARRARGAALLAAAATLAFTSGCSGDATAGSQASLEKPNLKVAVVPALDSAGFFVALYDGLFAGKGLHVTFSPATSSDKVISAQVRGPNFPVERYVVTKQWAQKYPRTLAAFDEALEQGSRSRTATGPRSSRPWKTCLPSPCRSPCPSRSRRSWRWTITRSPPAARRP